MIIGQYSSRISEKSRIAFPKKFRDELGSDLVVTKGYEGCLLILSPVQWEEMVADSISGPFVSGLIRDTSRFLMGSAAEVTLDSQGRFVIPAHLKNYAELADEGVFLGLGRWVELWGQKSWSEKQKEVEDRSSDVAERLADLPVNQ